MANNQEITKAVQEVKNAMVNLLSVTEDMNEDQIAKFSADYPFDKDFREIMADVINWAEHVRTELK